VSRRVSDGAWGESEIPMRSVDFVCHARNHLCWWEIAVVSKRSYKNMKSLVSFEKGRFLHLNDTV
jgi:hypothetical protein